jgi:hypothetical protein
MITEDFEMTAHIEFVISSHREKSFFRLQRRRSNCTTSDIAAVIETVLPGQLDELLGLRFDTITRAGYEIF